MKMKKNVQEIGPKKIINDFIRFINSYSFKEEIIFLRKKYKIPKSGLNLVTRPNTKKIEEVTVLIPGKWGRDKHISCGIRLDLKKVTNYFPLHGPEWDDIFCTYLFYNYIPEKYMKKHLLKENLCKIVDLKSEFDEYDTISFINLLKNEKEKCEVYPIAIKITPYASRNVIVDFIKQNLKFIEALQKKYKDPSATLGKTRSRVASKKHDFIYKNKSKLRKTIAELTDKKFGGNHRPENIRVVISRKKRGE